MARRDDDHQNDSPRAQAERAEAAERVREEERARRDGHIARFKLLAQRHGLTGGETQDVLVGLGDYEALGGTSCTHPVARAVTGPGCEPGCSACGTYFGGLAHAADARLLYEGGTKPYPCPPDCESCRALKMGWTPGQPWPLDQGPAQIDRLREELRASESRRLGCEAQLRMVQARIEGMTAWLRGQIAEAEVKYQEARRTLHAGHMIEWQSRHEALRFTLRSLELVIDEVSHA